MSGFPSTRYPELTVPLFCIAGSSLSITLIFQMGFGYVLETRTRDRSPAQNMSESRKPRLSLSKILLIRWASNLRRAGLWLCGMSPSQATTCSLHRSGRVRRANARNCRAQSVDKLILAAFLATGIPGKTDSETRQELQYDDGSASARVLECFHAAPAPGRRKTIKRRNRKHADCWRTHVTHAMDTIHMTPPSRTSKAH